MTPEETAAVKYLEEYRATENHPLKVVAAIMRRLVARVEELEDENEDLRDAIAIRPDVERLEAALSPAPEAPACEHDFLGAIGGPGWAHCRKCGARASDAPATRAGEGTPEATWKHWAEGETGSSFFAAEKPFEKAPAPEAKGADDDE